MRFRSLTLALGMLFLSETSLYAKYPPEIVTPKFVSADKQGRWNEIIAKAQVAFSLRDQEGQLSGSKQDAVRERRAALFFQVATLTEMWDETYMTTKNPTPDAVYMAFVEGLYWEYSVNYSRALIHYTEAEAMIEDLQSSGQINSITMPTYRGRPIAELLPEHIQAAQHPLQHSQQPSGLQMVSASAIFGANSNDGERIWLAVAKRHPKWFSASLYTDVSTGLDIVSATRFGDELNKVAEIHPN